MKHLGDITKINGAEAPIVDVICGGSPCQDLSVAGLRKGLQHSSLGDDETTRSGLFMEQIRIFKEQRDECIRQLRLRGSDVDLRYVKPRFLVWENVPGAFSSNKGEDFRCVLEEFCRIADKTATVPLPEKGKWSNSGCIVGDGWSVAYRVHDSQFWGVPQRRRRIAVVGDFGSESAAEILFERESVSGDIEQSSKEREETSATVGDGTPTASNVFGDSIMPTLVSRLETPVGNTQDGFNVVSFQERGGKPGGGKGILIQDEKTASIRTNMNQSVCYGFEPGVAKRLDPENRFSEETTPTLRANMGDNQTSVVCLNDQGGSQMSVTSDMTGTLRAEEHGHQPIMCYGMDNERRRGPEEHNDQSPTITAKCGTGGNNVPVVLEGNGSRPSHQGDGFKESEISYTLNSTEVHGVCHDYVPMIMDTYQKTTGALCASGYEKLGTQEAMNDMYVVSHGGFMVDADDSGKAHTLQATDYKDPQVVAYGVDCYNQSMSEEQSKALTCSATDSDHVPCVAYGLDSYNQTAPEEKAETLRTNGGGDNSPKVVVSGVDVYNTKITGDVVSPLTCNQNATSTQPVVMTEKNNE